MTGGMFIKLTPEANGWQHPSDERPSAQRTAFHFGRSRQRFVRGM